MFALPDLPYAYDALQPVISAETMRFHHDKHHAAYVKTVNDLLAEKSGQDHILEDVILEASKSRDKRLFKQRRSGMEPRVFLVLDGPKPPLPNRPTSSVHHLNLRRPRWPEGGIGQGGRGPFRGRVGLADRRPHSGAQADFDSRRGMSRDRRRRHRASGVRPLGARLLHRLPRRPEGLP